MNKKYQIWDKTSNVYTPSGAEFTPEQWIARYKWINNPNMTCVLSAGSFNGALIDELSRMKSRAEDQGAMFEDNLSNEELLDSIAAWEDEQKQKSEQMASEPTSEERIAAALEYQNLASLM